MGNVTGIRVEGFSGILSGNNVSGLSSITVNLTLPDKYDVEKVQNLTRFINKKFGTRLSDVDVMAIAMRIAEMDPAKEQNANSWISKLKDFAPVAAILSAISDTGQIAEILSNIWQQLK